MTTRKRKRKASIPLTLTGRGFDIGYFDDGNGVKCCIQKSSAAERPFIWLGADSIGLKRFGDKGWTDVDTSGPGVIAHNRMHLTRKNVEALLPLLRRFVRTGEIK